MFFIVFMFLVVWLFMSFRNLGNFEFVLLFIIFLAYFLYLMNEKPVHEYFVDGESTVVQEESAAVVVQEEWVQPEEVLEEGDDGNIHRYTNLRMREITQENKLKYGSSNVQKGQGTKGTGGGSRESKWSLQRDETAVVGFGGFVQAMKNTVVQAGQALKQVAQLPSEIKRRVMPEMDRLVSDTLPKDPLGNYLEFTSFDTATFSNDPYIASDKGNINMAAFSNLRDEYKACDAVFRDLRFADCNLYISTFYS